MIQLYSRLPVEACLEKLSARIDSPWRMGGRQAIVGTLNGNQLLIRKRLSLLVRNDFQPNLAATLSPDADGTTISCRFVLNPITLAVLVLWMAGVFYFALAVAPRVISELSEPNHPADTWMGLGLPASMLVFMMALVGGSWLLSDDRAFLLNFLRSQLDATVLADKQQSSV